MRSVSSRINNNIIKYQFIKPDNSKLTYADFINLLKTKDKDFIKEFDRQLNRASVELSHQPTAYFWECIPVPANTIKREFEFVVVKSEALDNITQSLSSFQEHFKKNQDDQVVSFPSLSGDTLVVPMPVRGVADEILDYKNLKEFSRNASIEQKEKFWQKVGEKMEENLLNAVNRPRWLSTSGLGVSYLHVRIDSRPKYYSFDEYKEYKKNENTNLPTPNKPDKNEQNNNFLLDNNLRTEDNNSSSILSNNISPSIESSSKSNPNIDKKEISKKTTKASNQTSEPPRLVNYALWISCGIGTILAIGLSLVIWQKQKAK